MRKILLIILLSNLTNIVFAQNFGCYSTPTTGSHVLSGIYDKLNQDSLFWTDYDITYVNDGFQTFMRNKYQVKMKGNVINGKKEGIWFAFFKETNGFYKLNYSNNQKEGICEEFYVLKNDTVLQSTRYYKNDLLEGEFIIFKNNDTITIKNYLNGKLNGVCKYFNFSKSNKKYLESVCYYKNGEKEGVDKQFKLDKKENPYLNELSEYSNGNQIGKEIRFSYNGDTLKVIEYSIKNPHGDILFEKREYNGKFLISKNKKNEIYESYNFSSNGDTTFVEIFDNESIKCKYYILDSLNNKWKVDRELNYYNKNNDFDYKKYYNNGQLAYEITFKDSLLFTAIVAYSIDGEKLDIGNLKEGNGVLNCYYSDGQLKSSYTYKNSICLDEIKNYYQNGEIEVSGKMYNHNPYKYSISNYTNEGEDINRFYLEKRLIGKIYSFFENQSKRAEILFDTISFETSFKYFFSNGTPSSIFKTKNDEEIGSYCSFYKNGNLEIQGNYKDISKRHTVMDSIWNYYYENGQLKASINYNDGEKADKSKYYDEDGNLKRIEVIEKNGVRFNIFNGDTVNFTDIKGLKQGKWISLKDVFYGRESQCDDTPISIEYFKNDKPIGTWEERNRFYRGNKKIVWLDSTIAYVYIYNKDDILIEEGEMVDANLKFGMWKEYDEESGFIKAKGEYFCDNKIGIWETYKKNGKIDKLINYDRKK